MESIYDIENVEFGGDKGQWIICGRQKEVFFNDEGRLMVRFTGEKTVEPGGEQLRALIEAAKKGKK